MNQDNIHDALNMLDDELINEVSKLRDIRKKRKRNESFDSRICQKIASLY